VLIIAEQSKGKLQSSTLSSIGAGLALKAGDVDVLVIGGGEGEAVRLSMHVTWDVTINVFNRLLQNKLRN